MSCVTTLFLYSTLVYIFHSCQFFTKLNSQVSECQSNSRFYPDDILQGAGEGDLCLHHVELGQVPPALGVFCPEGRPKGVHRWEGPVARVKQVATR